MPEGSVLTTERASRAKEGIKWDRVLLGTNFLLSIIMFAVAGLDSGRYMWSGEVPMTATIAGGVLMVIGQLLFAWAKRVNMFFFSTLLIDSERGHQVCDKGPYRYIRHPGYLGMIVSIIGFPLVMNSYWSFLPMLAAAINLMIRTFREDLYLQENLKGYDTYILVTRWRLIPGIF